MEQVAAEIKIIESTLGKLRESREAEIANAPFSVADPDSLIQLKRDIRASYQADSSR